MAESFAIPAGPEMKITAIKFYFACLLLGVILQALFPVWKGQIYARNWLMPGPALSSKALPGDKGKATMIQPGQEQILYRGGAFAIGKSSKFETRSLVWNPPSASSDMVPSAVRWPFEKPSQQYQVELVPVRMLFELTGLMAVLGLSVRIWFAVRHFVPTQFVTTAFWVSICLGLGWAFLGCMFIMSSGYAMVDEIIMPTLVCSLLAGLMLGAVMGRRRAKRLAANSNLAPEP